MAEYLMTLKDGTQIRVEVVEGTLEILVQDNSGDGTYVRLTKDRARKLKNIIDEFLEEK